MKQCLNRVGNENVIPSVFDPNNRGVDFFLLPDGSCVLNEPNTLPGFTKISMYPKLFIDSGLSYPEIIDRLITLAIEAQYWAERGLFHGSATHRRL